VIVKSARQARQRNRGDPFGRRQDGIALYKASGSREAGARGHAQATKTEHAIPARKNNYSEINALRRMFFDMVGRAGLEPATRPL